MPVDESVIEEKINEHWRSLDTIQKRYEHVPGWHNARAEDLLACARS
jgi:hypothetical protein